MITIRQEQTKDIPMIYQVNSLAFESQVEAEIVNKLRSRGNVTLSLVAELEGAVVGHILFTPVRIVTPGGESSAVGLGPMAVLPAYQGQGIGSRLVEQGLSECKKLDQQLVIVLGHPQYYPRFGFQKASKFGIRCQETVPEEAFMLVELAEGAAQGFANGVVYYQPEFWEE